MLNNFKIFGFFILCFTFASQAGAEISQNSKSFIVVIEFAANQSLADRFKLNLPEAPSCKTFREYASDESNDELANHAADVFVEFKSRAPEIAVLPLTIDSTNKRSQADVLWRYYDVFDCLDELAKSKDFKGINISVHTLEARKNILSLEGLKSYLSIREAFSQRIKKFLLTHSHITVAMALGNTEERLEDFLALPVTAVCNEDAPENLFCVTSFWHDPVYPFLKEGAATRKFPIGPFNFEYKKTPDGTREAPLPLSARHSSSRNLLAVGSISSKTSFLSPLFLALYLTNQVKVSSGFALGLSQDSSKLDVFPVRHIIPLSKADGNK